MSNEPVSEEKNDKYIAAIDAGTSSVRVILFNKNGEICGLEQEELTLKTPKSGWVEQSADEISPVHCRWSDIVVFLAVLTYYT